MENAPLTPLHPQVPTILESLGLRMIDIIQWDVLACTPVAETSNEPTLVLKFGADERKSQTIEYEAKIMSEVLPTLDQSQFERLVLPEFMNDGVTGGVRWMTTRFIPGVQLVRQWSDITAIGDKLGGRTIDAAVAQISVDVLRDLRSVDIKTLPKFVRKFDYAAWLETFKVRAPELVQHGILEKHTVDKALELLSGKNAARYEGSMFTNGDFYPRNFIILGGGKIAVCDWVGGIDPWEFVAMHAWLLMWGNAKWQIEYVNEIKKHFPIDEDEMQAGLLVRSFDLIYRWKDLPEETIGFARTQMEAYFRQALEKEYVRALFA